MRISLLLLTLTICFAGNSQCYNDMIKIDGEYFNIYPRPILTLVLDSASKIEKYAHTSPQGSDEKHSSLYEIRNDSLFLIEFLAIENGVSKFYIDSLYFDFSEPMFITATGDFYLQHCNEWKKKINKLKNPKGYFESYKSKNNDEVLHLIEGHVMHQILSQSCEYVLYEYYGRFELVDYYWEWGDEHDSIFFESLNDSCKNYRFDYGGFSFAELPIGFYNLHFHNYDGKTAKTIHDISIEEDKVLSLEYSHGFNGNSMTSREYFFKYRC